MQFANYDIKILDFEMYYLTFIIYLYYSKTNLKSRMNGERYNGDPLIMPVETYPFQFDEYHNQPDMPIGYKSLHTQIKEK